VADPVLQDSVRRQLGARTIDALWRAISDICALYSEQECWNYLKDAGYAPD